MPKIKLVATSWKATFFGSFLNKSYPNENTEALAIRLLGKLKEALRERAVRNRRSMSQEVVLLIELALERLDEDETPRDRHSV